MFFWFPAGLVLYWVVNNILSIAQQWQITRMIESRRQGCQRRESLRCEPRHHRCHRHGPRPWWCRRHPHLGQQFAALCFCADRQDAQAALCDAGRLQGRRRATIDSGILLFFPNPHSFTGEDVLELQGHGGPVVMQMLLARCLDLGARLAEPGEFSRRAFLNGKLDLAQAEAVADLIDAATASAARSAVRSLQGEFSRAIGELNDELINLRMLVEATLDFPEEDIDFLQAANAFGRLERLQLKLAEIFDRAGQGKLLQSGLHVVLAGQPNVGKSSLLNRLAGDDLAIVTPIAGTTRDALRSTIQIEGIPLHIIDTAGLRETDDEVEKIGIARSWQEIERADVVLLLVDARTGVGEADREILARLPERLQRITVYNKIDLAGASRTPR
jgi:tRNA modification GTPase